MRTRLSAFYDLLSSMRFAVSLLVIIAIASVIGTVLRQGEPYPNYVAQFGPFWFAIFEWLGLYDVYHAWWFLGILAFLVLSTSLCISRHAPTYLREIRSFREHATERSLRAFAHQRSWHSPLPLAEALTRVEALLLQRGFRLRRNERQDGLLVAAKAGAWHRLGYLFTHIGIVVICVGGLLDGNLPLQLQRLLGYKQIETRDIPQSQVPPISRLTPANLAFRGNVTVPENGEVGVVFLNVGDGYLVQDLPFTLRLKKFHIDHYATGQPKDFASDIEVEDPASGEKKSGTVRVNQPLHFKGISIYQASFGDGGTKLNLQAWSLGARGKPVNQPLQAAIKQAVTYQLGNQEYQIEFGDFRPFNVENIAPPAENEKERDRFRSTLAVTSPKKMSNLGPAFQYKVRDAQGQAREYLNYMQPVLLDEQWFLVSGMRETPNEPFRYLRMPLDDQQRIDGYMQMRALLLDPASRQQVVQRFALQAQKTSNNPAMRQTLTDSANRVLELFVGGGFQALATQMQQHVPAAEQERAAQLYLKVLDAVLREAVLLARERAGQPAPNDVDLARFTRDCINAFNDTIFYGAPTYLQLINYDEVKASGFQLTRAPGQNIVYGGFVLLILGVFAMFYVNERRVWVLMQPQTDGCTLLLAVSSNRKTLDFEREYAQLAEQLHAALPGVSGQTD